MEFGVWRLAFDVRRFAFAFVLERCLQKRRVNPIRSAFSRPRDEADLSGRQYRAWASSDRLRSKSGLG